MYHVSIPIEDSVEIIDKVSISPFVSKVKIKVCYIAEDENDANRNHSVLLKDVVKEIARKIPGSPIVGYYDKDDGKFQEHSQQVQYDAQKKEYVLVDITKPYGFIDLNAKVWFQDFIDDNQIKRTYLVTEGYLWDCYEETAQIKEGLNQSMELKNSTGKWAISNKTNTPIFIFNEALLEKICILGKDFEPCFEGAQIKTEFALDNLKQQMFTLKEQIKEFYNKGGSPVDFEMLKTEYEELKEKYSTLEKGNTELQEKYSTLQAEQATDKENYSALEEKFNTKVEEYTALENEKNELNDKFNTLETEYNTLKEEIKPLQEFKAGKELEEKQAMINKFYMLSDEDKKDVMTNIEKYSLDDIESKLAVICVRNKVNFSAQEPNENQQITTFSLMGRDNQVDNSDALQALREMKAKLEN